MLREMIEMGELPNNSKELQLISRLAAGLAEYFGSDRVDISNVVEASAILADVFEGRGNFIALQYPPMKDGPHAPFDAEEQE
jgi:hypothetical protein